jgi:hypothetical protein
MSHNVTVSAVISPTQLLAVEALADGFAGSDPFSGSYAHPGCRRRGMGHNVLRLAAKTSKSLSHMDRILPSSPVPFHTDLPKPDISFRNRGLMNVA